MLWADAMSTRGLVQGALLWWQMSSFYCGQRQEGLPCDQIALPKEGSSSSSGQGHEEWERGHWAGSGDWEAGEAVAAELQEGEGPR